MPSFLVRPNKKYSTTLAAAVTNTTDTTFTVNAVPTRVPCILLIDPGTAKEEKVKVTAKGVSTLTVVRNFDGVHADTHDLGASVVDYNSPEYITAIADVIEANFDSANTLITTNAQLTTPKVITSINDTNGNELIEVQATASAVNHVKIRNHAAGNNPEISAAGDGTNLDLRLVGKGTGKVLLGSASLKFPNVDGTSGQVLTTDGSAVLSWSAAAGSMTDAGAYVKPATDGDEIRVYHSDTTSYIEIQNDGTDSKVTSGTGHLVLTPASNKLVKLAVLRQSDTTNTYTNNTVILTGQGKIVGDDSADVSEAITFGITFAAAPVIVANFVGYNAAGSFAYPPTGGSQSDVYAQASLPTTTGATIYIRRTDGGSLSSGSDWYYTWIAIGVL